MLDRIQSAFRRFLALHDETRRGLVVGFKRIDLLIGIITEMEPPSAAFILGMIMAEMERQTPGMLVAFKNGLAFAHLDRENPETPAVIH